MANRHTLHINKIPLFKNFLEREGFEILPTKGCYEVLRAKNEKGIIVFFIKDNAKEHCTVMDKDMWIVRKFLRGKTDG